MLYIFGVCERCKEPIELKVNYVAMEKDADVSVRLELIHKPNAINGTVCGGVIHVLSVTEAQDEDICSIVPLELWQMLYQEGMSLRAIAEAFGTSYFKIYTALAKNKNRGVIVTGLRRRGRPSKCGGDNDS